MEHFNTALFNFWKRKVAVWHQAVACRSTYKCNNEKTHKVHARASPVKKRERNKNRWSHPSLSLNHKLYIQDSISCAV